MVEINEEIRKKLLILAQKRSQENITFCERITKSQKKILGLKIPDMRKIAKETAKDLSFENAVSIIENCDKNVFEEVFICGIIISYSKLPDEEKIKAFTIYLEFVDSWALIDSAVMTKNSQKINEQLWEEFSVECLASQKEFVVRFGIVFMLYHFVCENKIDRVFEYLRKIKHNGYYVKMAAAWLYAEAAESFFDKTINELTRENTDVWIKNKAFQKMIESFKIASEKKEFIRNLRKHQ